MRKTIILLALVMGLCFLITGYASAGYVKSKELTINDVKSQFEHQVNNKGFKNSLKVESFLGIYQEGKKAIVYFVVSGISYMNGKKIRRFVKAECVQFNDSRWFCGINFDESNFSSGFFLENKKD